MSRVGSYFGLAVLILGSITVASRAQAQTAGLVTETVVVNPVWINQTNLISGFEVSPSYGSVSQTSTLEGYTITNIESEPANRGTQIREVIILGGVLSDPGASWMQSITCNGQAFTLGARTYNATAQTVGYGWLHPYVGMGRVFNPGVPVTCQIVHAGNSGWVRPKYQVVGLTYAPPGARSTATYTNGFQGGTGTSSAASFSSSYTNKISIGAGGSFFGVISGKTTLTASSGWSQEQDSSSSVSVVQQNSTGLVVPGPASSSAGVNHDYDTVYVWLNPEVFVELGKNSIYQGGYGWDERDTVTGMDVVTLTVGQLRGAQPISDPALVTRLARTWDSSLGGLTTTDYQQIAAADPFFVNPSFNPNTDTSHRFELPESGSPAQPTDLIMNFIPAPPGGQATTQNYSSSYSATAMTGQTAKDTHTTTFTIDATGSASFFASLSLDLSSSATFTTSNQWSSTTSSSTMQTANFSIVSPLATDNYTGPTAIQVWKDNVYGTFMFFPEN